MPNHVTHRVIVIGSSDRLDAFTKAFITTHAVTDRDERPTGEFFDRFDFQTIIPSPACLEGIESGSNTEIGLTAIGREDVLSGDRFFSSVLSYPWVQKLGISSPAQLATWAESNRPGAIEMGKRAAAAYDECGYKDWYDWNNANWGTKWNSYDFLFVEHEPERLEFKFDTAWSSPSPIWEALAQRPEMQGLTLEFKAFDEGWYPVTTGTIRDGIYVEQQEEATDELYEWVHGETPDRGDDEDNAAEGEAA